MVCPALSSCSLASCQHLPVLQLAMDPTAWGSCPGSVSRQLMLEVGTSSQPFREWLRAPHYSGTRVTQGIWDTWASPNVSGGAQMCLGCQGCECPLKAEPGFEGKVVEFVGTPMLGVPIGLQLLHTTSVGVQLALVEQ